MTDIERCVKNMVQWNNTNMPEDVKNLAKEFEGKPKFAGKLPKDVSYDTPYAVKVTGIIRDGFLKQYFIGYFRWYKNRADRAKRYFGPEMTFSCSDNGSDINNGNFSFIDYGNVKDFSMRNIKSIAKCNCSLEKAGDNRSDLIELKKEDI